MTMNTQVSVTPTQDKYRDGSESTALPEVAFDLGAMLKDSVDRTPHGHKAVASEVGYQPDYWSRVLTSERGITLDRLAKLPVDVQRAFLASWGQKLGVRVERRNVDPTVQVLMEMLQERRVRISLEAT